MLILTGKMNKSDLESIEKETFFSDINMIKAVVDIDQETIALNAELHSDL